MSTRPTKEQIVHARSFLSDRLESLTICGFELTAEMIRILLAATEPTSDEQLAEEAARSADATMHTGPLSTHDVPGVLDIYRNGWDPLFSKWAAYALGFMRGARREGRQ